MLHVKQRTISTFRHIALGSLLFCTACASIPMPSFASAEKAGQADSQRTYEMLELFGSVFERVRRDYVEETEDEELVEAAINGMLTSLDPHSGYLNRKHFEEMQVQTKGEFGGLGIEVTMENGLVKVVSPIDDTPAYKAGVEAGDYISQIDGEAIMGMTLSEAVEKMRGPVGTDIIITVLRKGAKKPMDISITRDLIVIKSVRSERLTDVGYVRITSFSEQTHDAMVDAVNAIKKDNKELKGYVLDLRNNPGGLLDQAISVSDAFLERGEIVSTRSRNPKDTQRWSASEGDIADGLPIVVLINQGSASASEIVAGALKDHDRGIVMGTQSFGKGSVQTVVPLPQHGAMRLTTSRYYTPSGVSIQAKGIEPDIIVKPAKIELLETIEGRSEADLRGSLSNEQDDETLKQLIADAATKENEDGETSSDVDIKEDYQLERAFDLIRGLHIYGKTTPADKATDADKS